MVAAIPPLEIIIMMQVGIVCYDFHFYHWFTSRKVLVQPEEHMWCTPLCQKMCTRDILWKEKNMTLGYACGKCYTLKKRIILKSDLNSSKRK